MSSELTQLPSSYLIVAGGLIGSVVTMMIGKILDLFQKSREHKYSIQKEFFNKKLSSAEVLDSSLQKMTSLYSPLAISLQKMTDFAATEHMEIYSDFFQKHLAKIQKIAEDIDGLSYSAALYFDMEAIEKSAVTCFEAVMNSVLMLALAAQKVPSANEADKEILKKEVIKIFEEMSSAIKSLKATTNELLSQIRIEMRKYEP